MIDIRDIRVGNWLSVHHPTMPAEDIQISVDWLKTIERINNGLIKEDSPLFRIVKPIPLTTEMLEKNGFKRSEVFVEWKYENDDVYMIYKPFPYLKIQMEDCIVAFPCEYVHELQNALRLCGIEKEITI